MGLTSLHYQEHVRGRDRKPAHPGYFFVICQDLQVLVSV